MATASAPLLETDLREAAEERYLSYALSVITSRALPDVRDGLKPVQRRILYAMYQNLRLTAGARPRKSAAIVGEVLGKYHPHGDLAAYEAMVRMAQPFSLRYPLVHGEGNFGSLDGDSAAAMRYTEAKLTRARRGAARRPRRRHGPVPRQLRRDAATSRSCCRARIPQLLMNGSTGIAVGMATNIPPHNLREIVAALLAMIDDARHRREGPAEAREGPRLPDRRRDPQLASRELREIYETGQGPVRLRGEYTVETLRARQAAGRRHVDPVHRQQGGAGRGDRERDHRAEAAARRRRARRVDHRRARRARAQARGLGRGGDGLPLQAHRAADELQREPHLPAADGEPARRPAGARHAARPLPPLPRLPHDRRHAPARAREAASSSSGSTSSRRSSRSTTTSTARSASSGRPSRAPTPQSSS